jgi:beta-glucosidase
LLAALAETGKPITVVVLSGSALDLRQVDQQANAVVHAWYPGQDGGIALAEILFGDHNPSGRLPVTFVRSDEDLPPFEDYAMRGRTYRYLETEPMYPFGYGLSYTAFDYADFTVQEQAEGLQLAVTVTNSGARAGDEIVQIYHRHTQTPFPVPNFQLCAFKRVALEAGESQQVIFQLPPSTLEWIDEAGQAVRVPGVVRFFAGGQQPDARSAQLTGKLVLMQEQLLS